MSKPKHRSFTGFRSAPAIQLAVVFVVSSCSADSTFSSSSNWLKCRNDDECVVAFGEGSCSSEQICVDANGQPIPRDRRVNVSTTTDAGTFGTQTPSPDDGSTVTSEPGSSSADASIPLSAADASVANDAMTNDEASSGSAEAGPADARAGCAAACSQTDPFVLPLALCEDWNVFRDGQVYEFCDPLPTGTCEERCTEVVTRSSAACAEALPQVIECVTADGFYNDGASAAPSPTCLFPGCQVPLLQMASACSRRADEWRAARQLWLQSGVTTYRFQYDDSTIEVDGEEVTVVDGEALDFPPSVNDLFATIEASLDTPQAPIIVTYDATLGYPTRMRAYGLETPAGCAFANESVLSALTLD